MAGAGQRASLMGLRACGHAAFTMAEILLSLTIIGVVAAITLPSLTGNINERTWNTQRKALYARFSHALALMPSLNGYGDYTRGNDSTSVIDTATETFITNGLSKVLKINNICDAEHLTDCGIVNSFTNLAGSNINTPTKLSELNEMFTSSYNGHSNPQKINTKAAAFETQNGESILTFYNPNCQNRTNHTGMYYAQPLMCANFIYDLNGTKGPNQVGKDIGFITALYAVDPVLVAPLPLNKNVAIDASVTQINAGTRCQKQDSESRLPNLDELTSMFYNKNLIGNLSWYLLSSTIISNTLGWGIHFNTAEIRPYSRTGGANVRCIKR